MLIQRSLKVPSVSILSIDRKVWSPELVISKLVSFIRLHGKLVVDTSNEGPCLQTSGIESLVNEAVVLTGLPHELVTIYNSNLLPSAKLFNEICLDGLFELRQYKTVHAEPELGSIKYHYGNFIGRSNCMRLYLASTLNYLYKNKTLQSFHWERNHDYHRNHLGFEELLDQVSNVDFVLEFLKQCPLRFNEFECYPILNDSSVQLENQYRQIFVDIVCETYFSGNTFFITEKTLRPMAYRRPFILQGPRHFLKNLKKLGFQTFDRWWDESYDQDSWEYKHIAIAELIHTISQWSLDKLLTVYNEMSEVLEVNYQRVKTLTWEEATQCQFTNAEEL